MGEQSVAGWPAVRLNRRQVVGAGVVAISTALLSRGGIARADRFGEASQYVVTAPSASVYQQPDPSSKLVSTIPNGAHVVWLADVTGSNNSKWVQIIEGYVQANQVRESFDEWVAEVTADSIDLFAEADRNSAVMRTASKGDLLRVVGASPGLSGDPTIYWAASAGFAPYGTLQAGTSSWARNWTLPTAAEAPNGWWGAVASDANVRVGATTQAPVVGGLSSGAMVKVLSQANGENVQGSNVWYRIDGGRYAGAWIHSSLVQKVAPPQPVVAPVPGGTSQPLWIVVSKSASTLTVVQNGQPTFTTYTSLGLSGRQTPTGLYQTNPKFIADRMTSRTVPDALNEYDLPAVPWTQYYTGSGAAIHGAYWHDEFGSPHSEGCINLTWADSWYVFNQTQPVVPAGQITAKANGNATPVVIVD